MPNSLRFVDVLLLINIFNSNDLRDFDVLKTLFSDYSTNFDLISELFISLNLLNKKENFLIETKLYRKLFSKNNESNSYKDHFLYLFLFRKSKFSSLLNEFLKQFHYDKFFLFKPTIQQKLNYSVIRDFLVDLNFIELRDIGNLYIIFEEKNELFEDYLQKSNISLSQLIKIKNNQVKIGYKAECEIVEYEKKRLANFLSVTNNKIKHVSKTNPQAGFDILSFEGDTSNPQKIYIEVKAVNSIDFNFFWSRNEIDKSKILKSKYFLYLLPVNSNSTFEINELAIIRDPYCKIFSTKDWVVEEEVFNIKKFINKE